MVGGEANRCDTRHIRVFSFSSAKYGAVMLHLRLIGEDIRSHTHTNCDQPTCEIPFRLNQFDGMCLCHGDQITPSNPAIVQRSDSGMVHICLCVL